MAADVQVTGEVTNGPQMGKSVADSIQRQINGLTLPNLTSKGGSGGGGSTPGFIKGIGNIGTTATQNSQALQKAIQNIEDYREKTERAAASTKNFAEKIGETTKRFAAYIIPASAIFQLSRGIGTASDSVVELNAEINKLTQILDGNADRAKQVTANVLDLAEAYGVSGKEIIKVTNVLAQAGQQFGSNDQITRAVEALSRTKLLATFGDIESTTKGAIAALNQFGLSASDLNHVLDISNDLAKKFAVESADFFTAVQSGGAAFAVANGNIEEFSATVATLRQITRLSASTIGTGLNTIALRLLRPDVIKFTEDLTKGVGGIRNAGGQLQNVVGILRQVGQATKGMDSENLAKVIETLSGTRQGKLLAPLLRDIASGPDKSVFEQSFKVIGQSAGSAARDAAIGLQRIDVQLASIGARFDQVFSKFAQDKGIQRLVGDFAELAKGVASVLSFVEPLVPTLTKLAAIKIASSIFNNRGDILSGFGKPIGKGATLATGKAGDLSRNNNDFNINPNEPSYITRAKRLVAHFQQNPIVETTSKVPVVISDELLAKEVLKNDKFSNSLIKKHGTDDLEVLNRAGISHADIVDKARYNAPGALKIARKILEGKIPQETSAIPKTSVIAQVLNQEPTKRNSKGQFISSKIPLQKNTNSQFFDENGLPISKNVLFPKKQETLVQPTAIIEQPKSIIPQDFSGQIRSALFNKASFGTDINSLINPATTTGPTIKKASKDFDISDTSITQKLAEASRMRQEANDIFKGFVNTGSTFAPFSLAEKNPQERLQNKGLRIPSTFETVGIGSLFDKGKIANTGPLVVPVGSRETIPLTSIEKLISKRQPNLTGINIQQRGQDELIGGGLGGFRNLAGLFPNPEFVGQKRSGITGSFSKARDAIRDLGDSVGKTIVGKAVEAVSSELPRVFGPQNKTGNIVKGGGLGFGGLQGLFDNPKFITAGSSISGSFTSARDAILNLNKTVPVVETPIGPSKRFINRGIRSKNFVSDLEDQTRLNDQTFKQISTGQKIGTSKSVLSGLSSRLNLGIESERLLRDAIGERTFGTLGKADGGGVGFNGTSSPILFHKAVDFFQGGGASKFLSNEKSGLSRIGRRLGGSTGALARGISKFGPNALAAGGLILGDTLLNSVDDSQEFDQKGRLAGDFQSTFNSNRLKTVGGNILSLGATGAIAGLQFGGPVGGLVGGAAGLIGGAFKGASQANQNDLNAILLSGSHAKNVGDASKEISLLTQNLGIGVRENVGGLQGLGENALSSFGGAAVGGPIGQIASIFKSKQNRDLLLNTGRELFSTGSSKIDTFDSNLQEQFRTQQGRAFIAPIGEQAKKIAQQVAGQEGFTGDIGGEVRNRLSKESAISRLRASGLSKEDAEKAFAPKNKDERQAQTQGQRDIILESQNVIAVALKELGVDFNEIGDTVKKNKVEFDKLQTALSKNTASFEEFIFNFTRGTESINRENANNSLGLQGRKQTVGALFGESGGNFQLPGDLGQTIFNNILEDIQKVKPSTPFGPLGREQIFQTLDKGTGSFLDKNAKEVFTDAFGIKNLAEGASIDNLRKISGTVVTDQNKDNVGLVAQKTIENYFSQNGFNAVTSEGKGLLANLQDKAPDLVRKNPEFAKDIGGLANAILKDLADGKPIVERLNAGFGKLNGQLSEINFQYDIQKRVLASQVELQNKSFAFGTASIQQQGSLFGANPETTLQRLTNFGSTLPNADLGTASKNLKNAEFEASKFSVVDPKTAPAAARAFGELDKAQSEYNAELSKSNNQLSNFRARLDEAGKVLANTVQARQSLATTPFNERVQAQAQVGILNSLSNGSATQKVLSKVTSVQDIGRALKSGDLSQADIEGLAREQGNNAGNSTFINALKGSRTFGGLPTGGPGGQTFNQKADLLEFGAGLGVNPTGGTVHGNVESFAKQALEQAGLFEKTQDIEKNQLTNLQQINQNIAAIAKKFQVPLPNSTPNTNTNATTQPTTPTPPTVAAPVFIRTPPTVLPEKTRQRFEDEEVAADDVHYKLGQGKGNDDTKKLRTAIDKLEATFAQGRRGGAVDKSELKLDANVVLSGVQGLGNDVVVQEASIAVLEKLASILTTGTTAEQETANNIRAAINKIRGKK